MKKFLFVAVACVLVGCSGQNTPAAVSTTPSFPSAIESSSSPSASTPASSNVLNSSSEMEISSHEDITKWDEGLTEDIKSYMSETWGHPEWGADWYKGILDLKMFSDESVRCVLISNITDKSKLQAISAAVFQYEYWIDAVLIHNEDGKELLFIKNPLNPSAFKKIK